MVLSARGCARVSTRLSGDSQGHLPGERVLNGGPPRRCLGGLGVLSTKGHINGITIGDVLLEDSVLRRNDDTVHF